MRTHRLPLPPQCVPFSQRQDVFERDGQMACVLRVAIAALSSLGRLWRETDDEGRRILAMGTFLEIRAMVAPSALATRSSTTP